MDLQRVGSGLGPALPYVLTFAVGWFTVLVVVLAMAAVWHPDARRRTSAFKVLELLLTFVRPATGRQPKRGRSSTLE